MRKDISLPKEGEGQKFFNTYASTLQTFKRNSYFAQIVSAGTEIGVIYLFFHQKFAELMTPDNAVIAAVSVAAFGTYFLESGLRTSLISFIKQVLNKRWEGLHKWISFGDFVTAIVFIAISIILSFQGSKEVIAPSIVGEVKEQNYNGINSERSNREGIANETYNAEKLGIESRINNQITAIKNSYDAKIERQNKEYLKYKKKETNGKKYTTKLERIDLKRQDLRAEKAAEIAQLEANKSKNLAKAELTKTKSLSKTQKEYDSQKDKLDNKNEKSLKKNETQVKAWGLGFGWFSIIAVLYLIYALARIEIIKHGSGITETPRPSQYFFQMGAIAKLIETGKEQFQRISHGIIRTWEKRIKPPLPPHEKDLPTLFNNGEIEQPKIDIEFEGIDENLKISLPPLSENMVKQIAESEANLKKKEMRKMGFKMGNKSHQNLNSSENTPTIYAAPYSPNFTPKKAGSNLAKNVGEKLGAAPKKDTITYSGMNNEIEAREYTYSKVQSLIAKHKGRVMEAKAKLKSKPSKSVQRTHDNNLKRLNYWNNRIKEFF